MNKTIMWIKNNKNKLGVTFVICSFILYYIIFNFLNLNFSFDRLEIVSIVIIFISLHFFIDLKKMYDFIYKKRYLLAVIFLIFVVINKWNGSSIGAWNSFIEPNVKVENATPFLGIPRYIRSDEWRMSTMNNLSQATEQVNFSKYNSLMMAKDNIVVLNPRLLTKTPIAFFTSTFKLPYLFLDIEYAYSFSYFAPLIALFLITFELCMIISKKNKLISLMGAFLISLSPATVWWDTPGLLLYGELAILLIYWFFNTNNNWYKLLLSIFLGIVGANFVLALYPAWQVPYGYFFLGLIIWIILDSKNGFKWKDLLYIGLCIIVVAAMIIPLFIESKDVLNLLMNTVYPGQRASTGGSGDYWKLLFTYPSNFYYVFKSGMSNPCEYSQYISFFPIPLIMGIIYCVKNKTKNKDWFLIISSIISILLLVWILVPLPSFVSKITLLSYSTVTRAQLVLGYISIFMLVRILSIYSNTNIEKKKVKIYYFLIAIFITLFTVYIGNTFINLIANGYLNYICFIISFIIFLPAIYLLILNNKKANKYLFYIVIFILTISGLAVHPVSKGLSVVYQKPFAKKVQEIVKEDSDAIWILGGLDAISPNYLIANGAKTLNSTNFVPNFSLWKIIDPDGIYADIYNRYAHLVIEIVDTENEINLLETDTVLLKLNYEYVCKLNINYIAFSTEFNNKYDYKIIYDNDNMSIYKTNCQ